MERIRNMDLNTIIFGDYTLKTILIYGGIGVGAIILLTLLKKLFKSEDKSEHIQVVRCKSCGWQGQVSRYAGSCPKCSAPMGSQEAKRRS